MAKLVIATLVIAVVTSYVHAVTYGDILSAIESNKISTFKMVAAAGGIALDDRQFSGTAFLPRDEGWDYLLTALKTDLSTLLTNASLCAEIVNYHIVPDRKIRTTDFPAQGLPSIVAPTAVPGEALLLGRGVLDNKKYFYVRGYINQAIIDQTKHDLYLPYGIVNIVNNAIVPNFPLDPAAPAHAGPQTVYSLVASVPQLSDLLQIIQNAGLEDYLSQRDLAVTFFAPTNDGIRTAATQLGYSSVDVLLAKPQKFLHDFVANMVVPEMLNPQDMGDLDTFDMFSGYKIVIYNTNGDISVGAPRSIAKVLSEPLYVDPSVVYITDAALMA